MTLPHEPHAAKRDSPNPKGAAYASRADLRVFPRSAERQVENPASIVGDPYFACLITAISAPGPAWTPRAEPSLTIAGTTLGSREAT